MATIFIDRPDPGRCFECCWRASVLSVVGSCYRDNKSKLIKVVNRAIDIFPPRDIRNATTTEKWSLRNQSRIGKNTEQEILESPPLHPLI